MVVRKRQNEKEGYIIMMHVCVCMGAGCWGGFLCACLRT